MTIRSLRHALPLLSLLALPWTAASLEAQAGSPQERLHAPARTHWAEQGRSVARAQLKALSAPPSLGPRPQLVPLVARVEGTMKQALLPLNFPNEVVRFSPAEIQGRFYGTEGSAYSVSRYYQEASGGAFQVQGSVLRPVTLSKPSGEYVGRRDPNILNGVGDKLPSLIQEALAQADQDTDWKSYVEAGENRISAVVFLTAGVAGSCPGDRTHLWPHRYNLTELLGKPFETADRTSDGRPILIDDYILVSAEECNGLPAAAGVVTHETGHLLGLPDLYNVHDEENRGPVGHFDLMATGNYNHPDAPALLGAVSRAMLGWTEVREVTSGSLVVPDAATSRQVFRVPFRGSEEYLLLETRTRRGSDRALPGEGMLVWHVDASVLEARREENLVNADPSHWGVALIQADGRKDLERGVNRGDAGDVWPGAMQASRLDASTTPPARPYSQSAGRITLSNIASRTSANGIPEVSLVVATEEPSTGPRVMPESLPVLSVGAAIAIQLRVEGATGEFVWSGDAEGLSRLGLALDPTTGMVRGTVRGTPGESVTLTFRALTGSTVVASRSYTVQVLAAFSATADQLVSMILHPQAGQDAVVARQADLFGNQNGTLDLGDFVLLVQGGHLRLTPAESARYRGLLPAHLR